MALGDVGAAIGIAFTYFTILYLTGLGGLFSERSGIVNIGLEGLMIIGTVTGSYGAHVFTLPAPEGLGWGLPWGPVMGLLFGMLCGALFSGIHALATVTFRVDQIVSGVVINLVAVGIARFISTIFFGTATQSPSGQPHLDPMDIPLLSGLPWGLGKAFQDLSPIVVVAALLVFPAWFVLTEPGGASGCGRAERIPRPLAPSVFASRRSGTRECCSRGRSRSSRAHSSPWRSPTAGARARPGASASSPWRR
jgi:general nucleoside transport system permease protein